MSENELDQAEVGNSGADDHVEESENLLTIDTKNSERYSWSCLWAEIK